MAPSPAHDIIAGMKNLAWTLAVALLSLSPAGCGGGNGTSDTGTSDDVGSPMDTGAVDAGGTEVDAPSTTDAGITPDAGTPDAPTSPGEDANCSPPICEPPVPGCSYEGATACECGTLVCAPPSGTCDPACNRGEYCDVCGTSPMCEVRPEDMGRICPAIYMPVCGCDGVTYSNACALGSAGIALQYTGECTPPPGECSPACGADETCELCRGGAYACIPRGSAC